MPALLLHLTIARDMLHTAPSTEAGAAMRAHPAAYLLGAILPDLAYHDWFPLQVTMHLLGREYVKTDWGDIFHSRGTGRLAIALCRHARKCGATSDERRMSVALTAGYLTHYALDIVVHPLVNRLVSEDQAAKGDGQAPIVRHERIERAQSLLYHRELLGFDITCTPYPRDLVNAIAGSGAFVPRLSAELAAAFRAACLETHGRAPSPLQLTRWLSGTSQYGVLMSTPLARGQALAVDGLPELSARCYRGPRVDLPHELERAKQRARAAWATLDDMLRASSLSGDLLADFARQLPDTDLGSGE